MSDGADLGVEAGRALGAILGGKEPPTEDEQQTKEQMLERILAVSDPCEGTPVHEREFAEDMGGYSYAADCIAKAFLILEADDPGLLDRTPEPYTYPDDYEIEDLRGKSFERSGDSLAWEALMERWPDFDDWLGGATGFMVGFAFNAARHVKDLAPVQNPALMTITSPGED
jgi:hypothetical protein